MGSFSPRAACVMTTHTEFVQCLDAMGVLWPWLWRDGSAPLSWTPISTGIKNRVTKCDLQPTTYDKVIKTTSFDKVFFKFFAF